MINKKLFPILVILMSASIPDAIAESWGHKTRGYVFGRLSKYTEETSRDFGHLARAQIEHETEFKANLNAINQLRFQSNSINDDLSVKSSPDKREYYDIYPGENYIRTKSDNWVVQIGLQEVVWGEAFGLNYADIINPKDNRQTFFSDAGENRLPLMLFNGKSFFDYGELTGSIQLLYSPQPRFSQNLPVELYAGELFPQEQLTVIKQKTPSFFKTQEFGGKIASSFHGFDVALFTYSYLDRDAHYLLSSVSLTNITLKEEHNRIRSSGLSIAKPIYDFVLRTDIVYTNDKAINYQEGLALKSYSSNLVNALVSVDTPTYSDFSGVFILASSTLQKVKPQSFREKQEQYLIGKVTKKLTEDKSLEFSYIHELELSGKSIQTQLSWPLNGSTDLKFGGEFYFGHDNSNLAKLKNCSSVFFSLKNYFQL